MSGSVVIITSPDGGGQAPIKTRVKVTIEYDPPDFLDQKVVAKVTAQLQKEADKIVARYG